MIKWLVSAAVASMALAAPLPAPGAAKAAGLWTAKKPLPVAMAEVGVAALDGTIYAVGGTEQHGEAPRIWSSRLMMMYDRARNSWQTRAPLPHGLTHAGVAAAGSSR